MKHGHDQPQSFFFEKNYFIAKDINRQNDK